MIVWDRVTWYSKLAAVIFFIGILPIWTFFLGMKFEEAKNLYLQIDQNSPYVLPTIITHPKTEPASSTTPKETVLPVDSGIKGIITIGPTCPVVRMPPDPACADKPYAATLLITDNNSRDNQTIKATSEGKFSINLPPGSYSIKNASPSILPRIPEQTVTVYSHKFSVINIQGDTGIR